MGYYNSKLEEYRAKAPEGLTLQERMDAVKAQYEKMYEAHLEGIRSAYYYARQSNHPGSADLAKELRQAQKQWSDTVLKPKEDFFNELVKQQADGLYAHLDVVANTCRETEHKIARVEDGQGFVGTLGRVFGGIKDIAEDSLNQKLEAQQQDLSGLVDATKEFSQMGLQGLVEFVVGQFEQTGSNGYNPQEVTDFYKHNPVETATTLPAEQ